MIPIIRILLLLLTAGTARSDSSEYLCQELPPLENGKAEVINAPDTEQAKKFSCNTGYRLEGAPVLICGEFGQWNGTLPTCRVVVCPKLKLENGTRMVFGHSRTFGSYHEFSCTKGYTLVAQDYRRCEANGQWSKPTKICKAVEVKDSVSTSRSSSRFTWTKWYMFVVYGVACVFIVSLVVMSVCFSVRCRRRRRMMAFGQHGNGFKMTMLTKAATMSEDSDWETQQSVKSMDGQTSPTPSRKPAVLPVNAAQTGKTYVPYQRQRDGTSIRTSSSKKRRRKRSFFTQLSDEISNLFFSAEDHQRYTTLPVSSQVEQMPANMFPNSVQNTAAMELYRVNSTDVGVRV